jgi:hypothetical protein
MRSMAASTDPEKLLAQPDSAALIPDVSFGNI